MVTMMTEMVRWPSRGRSTSRSVAMPRRAEAATAARSATTKGACTALMAVQAKKAPSIMNSPVAKLMTRVAL